MRAYRSRWGEGAHSPQRPPSFRWGGAKIIRRNEERARGISRAGATPPPVTCMISGALMRTVGGAGYGQVSVIRLDDEAEFTEPLQVGD